MTQKMTSENGFAVFVLLTILLLSMILPVAEVSASSELDSWDFDVYLDDKKVGSHVFEVTQIDGVRQVESNAEFKVSVFFIPAYRYEHSSREVWQGDCLQNISASTNANGKQSQVTGARNSNEFEIATTNRESALPNCVMTFAYWNPKFLQQQQLLNPQTGAFQEVAVTHFGSEQLMVRGESVNADRYTVKANDVDVTLWYSDDDEWLALESVVKGGRTIRYELS